MAGSRAVTAQDLYDECGGGGGAERASCVRGKIGAEKRRDAESGTKRWKTGSAFSKGDGARARGGRDWLPGGGAYVTREESRLTRPFARGESIGEAGPSSY